MFLFGFPVLGAVVALGGQVLPPEVVFALALPATVGLAAMSWHLVESPALRLRHWVRRRDAARVSLDTSAV